MIELVEMEPSTSTRSRLVLLRFVILTGLLTFSESLFAQQGSTPTKASQIASLDDQLKAGLISKPRYEAKKKLIEAPPAEAAAASGPENMLLNAGFEEYNPNTKPTQSRWPGWGGWCWAGNYEFFKADGKNKHTGEAALGCRCNGAAGRIGLMCKLPVTKTDAKYEISLWIKGEGNNKLRVALESGASGGGEAVGSAEWKKVTFAALPDAGAKSFMLYLYIVGGGTLYVDDAMMVEN